MDIQVVLTENDPKLGKRGQVVKVSSGFAQNFLFPHNKAKLATPANLRLFDEEKARASKEEAERLAQAQETARRAASAELRIEVPAGPDGRLFGSVTSQDIAEALSKQGISMDRKKLHLEEPIRKLGRHEVPLKLHPDVQVMLKLELVKKP